MSKVRLFILLTLCALVAKAQQKKSAFTIKWTQSYLAESEQGERIKLPSFSNAIHQGEAKLPYYRFIRPGKIEAIQLVNAEYLIKEGDFKFKNPEKNPSSEIRYAYDRGKLVSIIDIPTINISKSSNQSISALASAEVVFKYAPQKNFKISSTNSFKTSSVLNEPGTTLKFAISKTGIYRINKNTIAQITSNPPEDISMENVKIFSFPGGMLPQENDAPISDDLIEIAAQNVIGGSGTIEGLLFYAEGPDKIYYDEDLQALNHEKNLYSDENYVFVKLSVIPGKRLSPTVHNTPQGNNLLSTSLTPSLVYSEDDLHNVLSSGREWFGHKFEFSGSKSYSVNLQDIDLSSDLKFFSAVCTNFPSASSQSSNFTVTGNGNSILNHTVFSNSTYEYGIRGRRDFKTATLPASGLTSNGALTINYTYSKPTGTSATGYVDYFDINYQRNLNIRENEAYLFLNPEAWKDSLDGIRFSFTGSSSNFSIWDVTNLSDIKSLQYSQNGNIIELEQDADTLRTYMAVAGNSFSEPRYVATVNSQNLHALGPADFLIISAPEFLNQSKSYGEYRKNQSGLSFHAVSTEQIYNEFSGGKQDITALRNFIKMIFQRSNTQDSLLNVLLVGDCSFDYKDRIGNNSNYVPTYQSYQSLHGLDTYMSDDYFGFLDPNEGEWREFGAGAVTLHYMDVGIGRFVVNNNAELNAVITKIKNYEDLSSSSGMWRNFIAFAADDEDNNIHFSECESLTRLANNRNSTFTEDKIYIDEFQQTSTPSGVISRDAQQALTRRLNDGCLFINYYGHGGISGLAQEGLVTIPQIDALDNFNNLPFWVTATCDFGKMDDPAFVSGGELVFKKSDGGGIGLLTTTRPVTTFSNSIINQRFIDFVFRKENGQYLSLGEIHRRTKNSSIVGVGNRNFTMVGDPSMKLAYPNATVIIDSIKDAQNGLNLDTIKALSQVEIQGSIVDNSGQKIQDFNGEVEVLLFDKKFQAKTKGDGQGSVANFEVWRNRIFKGKASAENGTFSVRFVVPKDINYSIGNGRLVAYAVNNTYSVDAHGTDDSLKVGGFNSSAANDDEPPEIQLFMDDESFTFGGTTGSNTLLLAKFFDDHGINISGAGIGHEITAKFADKESEVVVLNDFYESAKDDFQRGTVRYPYEELQPGTYGLKVKAWDTYNNSAEEYIEFVVANTEELAIDHVLNYPNPFNNVTYFQFDHNRAGDALSVKVDIFTISGKRIKTLLAENITASNTLISGMNPLYSDLTWDGRDEFGSKLGKGVYVYKVTVKSNSDNSKTSKYEKLVILN